MTKRNNDKKELLDSEIADAIMELPHSFNIGDETFYLYPITIGKTFLLERAYKRLKLNKPLLAVNPSLEALRLCHEDKEGVAMVISYHTFHNKSALINVRKITDRAKYFAQMLTEDDLASLFVLVSAPDKQNDFMEHLGIAQEKKWQKKAMKAKKDSDAMSFGGKSIYGTLIDFACERYGWRYDYVVWGISLINLQMLMADSVTTIYLSKEERKRANIPKDRTVISGDDPANREKLKQLLK